MKEFKGDNMNITKNYDGKELTVTVEGRVETTSAKELENAIKEEIGNFDSLILDFANLEYISSAGLRVMLITQKKLKGTKAELTIKNANEKIKKVFNVTRFDKIIKKKNSQ